MNMYILHIIKLNRQHYGNCYTSELPYTCIKCTLYWTRSDLKHISTHSGGKSLSSSMVPMKPNRVRICSAVLLGDTFVTWITLVLDVIMAPIWWWRTSIERHLNPCGKNALLLDFASMDSLSIVSRPSASRAHDCGTCNGARAAAWPVKRALIRTWRLLWQISK